ncbi:MAG: DUF6452 family protein [Muribaculaceae bacterium]
MRCTRGRIFTLTAATALLAGVALLPACNSEGCADNHSALPLIGFYDTHLGDPITLDSLAIGGVGAPGDSLLVAPGTAVQQVYLPFRFEQNEVAFFIRYAYPEQGLDVPALNDTITFRYTSEPYFASEDCGAMFRYRVTSLSHTTHLIDSVAVTDSLVTNIERERFKVYIRTTSGGDVPETVSHRRGLRR